MALRLISTASLLLVTMSLSVSAQTAAQKERLKQLVSELRICVRTNAPAAQEAGIKTAREAVDFFQEKCLPPLGLFLGQNVDLSKYDTGSIPPGIYARTALDEWTAVVEETRSR